MLRQNKLVRLLLTFFRSCQIFGVRLELNQLEYLGPNIKIRPSLTLILQSEKIVCDKRSSLFWEASGTEDSNVF
jgi:hypothetical protein